MKHDWKNKPKYSAYCEYCMERHTWDKGFEAELREITSEDLDTICKAKGYTSLSMALKKEILGE